MDYPYAKFGDFSFSRFGFYHADKQTHTERITDDVKRLLLLLLLFLSLVKMRVRKKLRKVIIIIIIIIIIFSEG